MNADPILAAIVDEFASPCGSCPPRPSATPCKACEADAARILAAVRPLIEAEVRERVASQITGLWADDYGRVRKAVAVAIARGEALRLEGLQ